MRCDVVDGAAIVAAVDHAAALTEQNRLLAAAVPDRRSRESRCRPARAGRCASWSRTSDGATGGRRPSSGSGPSSYVDIRTVAGGRPPDDQDGVADWLRAGAAELLAAVATVGAGRPGLDVHRAEAGRAGGSGAGCTRPPCTGRTRTLALGVRLRAAGRAGRRRGVRVARPARRSPGPGRPGSAGRRRDPAPARHRRRARRGRGVAGARRGRTGVDLGARARRRGRWPSAAERWTCCSPRLRRIPADDARLQVLGDAEMWRPGSERTGF